MVAGSAREAMRNKLKGKFIIIAGSVNLGITRRGSCMSISIGKCSGSSEEEAKGNQTTFEEKFNLNENEILGEVIYY